MNSKSVCNICYKTVFSSENPVFDDAILELLDIVFTSEQLKDVNLTDPTFCKMCIENINEVFDFKSRCVYIEDLLTPYLETSSSCLDLKEIGVKENLLSEKNVSEIEVICRLCFNTDITETINLNSAIDKNKLQHIFQINLSEVNIQLLEKSYICDLCLACLIKYSKLIGMTAHSSRKQVQVASEKTSSDNIKSDLKNLNHSTATLIKCNECSYTTAVKHHLVRHLVTHKNYEEVELFRCDKCPFQSKYLRSLQNHQKTVHSDSKVKCPHCPKELKSMPNLKKHLLTVHPATDAWFYCDKCSHKTRSKNGLRVHFRIHKDESEHTWYHCEQCSYKSHTKSKLARHMLLHQKTPPNHKCTKCEYSSNYKENLKKHMRKHDDNAEEYSCDQCNYKTIHKGYLKYHKAIHAEPGKVKTYKCPKCSYETIHQGNLVKQHMKIHGVVQVDVYKCDKCNFKTHYKAHFKNHAKTHKSLEEVELFKCDSCSFKTKHKVSMNRHVQLHQGKEST